MSTTKIESVTNLAAGVPARSPKQPFSYGMVDDSLFAFAGLWDRWKDAGGQTVESCSILTTTPNALLADVHDRMPVILRPEHYDWWLNPGFTRVEALKELLGPFDFTLMRGYPVSTRVNFVRNDDPDRAAVLQAGTPLLQIREFDHGLQI
jgi:putative SOS response-associated peptidase YedK